MKVDPHVVGEIPSSDHSLCAKCFHKPGTRLVEEPILTQAALTAEFIKDDPLPARLR